MMMNRRRLLVIIFPIFLLFQGILSQDNIFQKNRPEGTTGETFYLDQPSSCRSQSSYSVTGKTTIIGRSGTTGSSIPKECTITLASFAQKPMKFQLQIAQMRLNRDMKFYIFDGEITSALLKSYDYNKPNDNPFNAIYTTGSKVTFKLVRDRIDDNSNYEIRIIAETVEDVLISGGGWNTRLDRDDQTVRKFDTDIIIILMSCAFLFAFLIYGIVLAVRWRQGRNVKEKWTERPMGYDNPGLAQAISTQAYVEEVKSHPPDDPRVQSPANFHKINGRPAYNYQTRMAQSSVDADSVFEGEKGEKIRRRLESNHRPSQNGSYNHAYQQTPNKSRARLSNRNAKSSYSHKESSSPAVSDVPSLSHDVNRSRPKQEQPKYPEPVESDSEDEVERASIGLNTDPEMTDHGVQCEVEEPPEEAPAKQSTTLTSTGVGNSPVLNSHRNSPHPRHLYRPPSYEEALSETDFPSVKVVHPRPSPKIEARLPYVQYSDPALHHPQPTYSPHQHRPAYNLDYSRPNPFPKAGNDNHIPVYSYLVNRGYQIDDGQSSGDATSHRSDSRMGHTDDSDYIANLECGVELMRR